MESLERKWKFQHSFDNPMLFIYIFVYLYIYLFIDVGGTATREIEMNRLEQIDKIRLRKK